MFRPDNFISFHDLTPEARYLWVSPSVCDLLGYEIEHFDGLAVYDIIIPEDIVDNKKAHKENLMNDLVVSQTVVRFRHRDGHYVHCLVVFSLCYDFIVNCATLLDPSASAYVRKRAHSSVMTQMVGSKKEEFERVRRHHQAFAANSWNHQAMEPEARVCLILNRCTRSLIVMYASSACEKVLHVDPDDITGTPILLYIRADDLAPFVEQVDIIKASTAITQMRFWFQSPNCPQEIPCEAIVIGAADGIVAVIRRSRPFVRKHFITDREFYESGQGSSWSSGRKVSFGSSPISPIPSPSTSGSYGFKSPSPPQNLPRTTLNRIRILELNDDERVRPMINLPEDDPSLVFDITVVNEVPAFKEIIVQDYDEGGDRDDMGDLGIRHLNISNQGDSYGDFNCREW